MKKRIVLALIIAVVTAGAVFAAGGKNQNQHHGAIGQGTVVQNQVRVNR